MKKTSSKAVTSPVQKLHPAIQELHPARLLDLCKTSRLARTVIVHDDAGSTNEIAMAAAANGAPEGLLVIAEEQMFGRGRKGRRWISSRGKSLTCSLLLRPGRNEEGLTAILALAVVNALGEFVSGIGIKWPNDIFCRGKKLGGILAESKNASVVMGLGLNINESADDFAAEIAGEAISLRMAARKQFDRGFVLCRILEAFETLYDRFQREGFASFRVAVQQELLFIGKLVLIESGGGSFVGNMIGITNEGYLCIDIDGAERVFASGDLTLRERPQRR
jgi:BirA family biotin operon repressor/biotin-[acetyl-CoA-carboxylase] ligase